MMRDRTTCSISTHHFCVCLGKRKRTPFQQDVSAVLQEIHSEDLEQQRLDRIQRDHHIQLLLNDARKARELEATLRREDSARNAAFN